MKDERQMRTEHSPTGAERGARGQNPSVRVARRTLIFPVLLIAVGTGWLLTELDVAPRIEWVWSLGLATVGVLAFAVGGWDKVTAVLGPFFLIASGCSVARQAGHLEINIEIPVLAIAAGVLLLIARSPTIPFPKWIIEEPAPRE